MVKTSEIIKLSSATLADWKEQCINEFMAVGALKIVRGSERPPRMSQTPTMDEEKRMLEYEKRKQAAAAFLRSTLDAGQRTLIQALEPEDVEGAWDTILAHFESKDVGSRFFGTQKLLMLRKGETGHEEENYYEFGSRVVAAADIIKNLLPMGAQYEQEVTKMATYKAEVVTPAVPPTDTTGYTPAVVTPSTFTQATLRPSVFKLNYTAEMYVEELAINVIVVGLGSSESDRQLKRILIHNSTDTLEECMEELRKADNLDASDLLGGIADAAALAARVVPTPPEQTKFCSHHGKGNHSSADCNFLRKQREEQNARGNEKKKKKQRAQLKAQLAKLEAELDDDEEEPKEKALVTQVKPARHLPLPSTPCADNSWNADSGATSHMTPHREWIRDFKPYRQAIGLADDSIVWSAGIGNVVFTPMIDGKPVESVIFTNVLYVPHLRNNLFSINQAVRDGKLGMRVIGTRYSFTADDEVIFTADVHQSITRLNGTTLAHDEQAFLVRVTQNLLHQRLAHIGRDRLDRMIKEELVDGVLVIPGDSIPDVCEHCVAGKQHRDPFPASERRSDRVIQLIHSNLKGPVPTTFQGYKYWAVFVCDCSRWKEVYLLKKKSDLFTALKHYVAKVERMHGTKVEVLRDDKGGEYISKEMTAWCNELGI